VDLTAEEERVMQNGLQIHANKSKDVVSERHSDHQPTRPIAACIDVLCSHGLTVVTATSVLVRRLLCHRGVLSWRHKDEYGSDSDTGRAFHVDNPTTAKLQRLCFILKKLLGDISKH